MNENNSTTTNIDEKLQDIELKKLKLELSQMSKPWWKKASVIVTLLLGFGTILTGVLTGWFENEYKLIELKRIALDREIQTLRQKELSFQITTRLDMLFKDKGLAHPENPSANALVLLLRKDLGNRQFYTRLLVDHLNASDVLIEKLMILYILHQGSLAHTAQQVFDSERWRWPNSEWTGQFFALAEENWDRPEMDKIIQFGDWRHFDPFSFAKWIELIETDVAQIDSDVEVLARCIHRVYYRTIPDKILQSELSDELIDKARYVFTHVGALETGLVSHEIFGYINAPSYLLKRKTQVIERFARFLNCLNRLDDTVTVFALSMILHQVKIGPESVREKVDEPIGKLFADLSMEIHRKLLDVSFPAYDSNKLQIDIDMFNDLGRKVYSEWLISRMEDLQPQQCRQLAKFIKLSTSTR